MHKKNSATKKQPHATFVKTVPQIIYDWNSDNKPFFSE